MRKRRRRCRRSAIGLLPNDDMISVLYAQQSGMFKAAGLDVVLDKSSPNGSAIATAVAAGSYEIGKSSITTMFDSHLHGLPFTIIGTAALYQAEKPYVGFIVPIDSPIKTTKQLGSGGADRRELRARPRPARDL